MATCKSAVITRSPDDQYHSDKFKPCTKPDVRTFHLHNASSFVLRQKYFDYDQVVFLQLVWVVIFWLVAVKHVSTVIDGIERGDLSPMSAKSLFSDEHKPLPTACPAWP